VRKKGKVELLKEQKGKVKKSGENQTRGGGDQKGLSTASKGQKQLLAKNYGDQQKKKPQKERDEQKKGKPTEGIITRHSPINN